MGSWKAQSHPPIDLAAAAAFFTRHAEIIPHLVTPLGWLHRSIENWIQQQFSPGGLGKVPRAFRRKLTHSTESLLYFGRWTLAFEPIFSSFCLTKNNGIKAKFSNKRDYFFKAGKIKKMERNEKYNWAWRWAKFLPTQLKRLVTTLHHQSNIDALKRDADRRPVLLTLNDASRNISSTAWFCCCCCVLNWNNRRKKWLTRGSLAMI